MPPEQLKREATRLERLLEDKISRFQQLAQKLWSASHADSSLSRAEQGSSDQALWDDATVLATDCERLLQQLQDLLLQPVNSTQERALQNRYREICADFRKDLEHARNRIRQAQDRRDLLSSSVAGSDGGVGGTDPAMEHLMRERNHIANSMRATDDVLGQADGIRSDLRQQGRSLQNVRGLMGSITTNVPGLNNLIDNIRRRRSRDDMVVAGVIATCILFTLWYVFG